MKGTEKILLHNSNNLIMELMDGEMAISNREMIVISLEMGMRMMMRCMNRLKKILLLMNMIHQKGIIERKTKLILIHCH